MKMYIGGQWVDKTDTIDVLNPFDGSVIDTIPKGDASDVDTAIASAERTLAPYVQLVDEGRNEGASGNLALTELNFLAHVVG